MLIKISFLTLAIFVLAVASHAVVRNEHRRRPTSSATEVGLIVVAGVTQVDDKRTARTDVELISLANGAHHDNKWHAPTPVASLAAFRLTTPFTLSAEQLLPLTTQC